MTWYDEHIRLIEGVNAGTISEDFLRGFRQGIVAAKGVSMGMLIMQGDEHYLRQGIDRPMCGGIFLDKPPASGGDEARRSSPTDVTNVGCERCSGTGQVSGPDKKVLVCAACGGRGRP